MLNDLGPVILERKPNTQRGYRLLAFACLFLIGGCFFFVRMLMGERNEDGSIPSVFYVMWGIAVFLACVAWYVFRHHFLIYQNGVQLKTIFRHRAMAFNEMSTFSCSAIRFHMNGIYRGTDLVITFFPELRSNHSKLVYSTRLHDDMEVNQFLDVITAPFTERLIKQLSMKGK